MQVNATKRKKIVYRNAHFSKFTEFKLKRAPDTDVDWKIPSKHSSFNLPFASLDVLCNSKDYF